MSQESRTLAAAFGPPFLSHQNMKLPFPPIDNFAEIKFLGSWLRTLRRTNGTRSVVCSGHFAPAHPGHLDYLEAATQLGTLVVVVNNDFQVKMKGSVPFMNELDRLRMVRALSCVNGLAVLSVDQDRSISKTLALLHPDYLANGGDVADESCVREADVCRAMGIQMVFGVGGSTKTRSSSSIISAASKWVPPA